MTECLRRWPVRKTTAEPFPDDQFLEVFGIWRRSGFREGKARNYLITELNILIGSAMSKLKCHDDDIRQEVALHVINKLSKFNNKRCTKPFSYFYRVIFRQATKLLKERSQDRKSHGRLVTHVNRVTANVTPTTHEYHEEMNLRFALLTSGQKIDTYVGEASRAGLPKTIQGGATIITGDGEGDGTVMRNHFCRFSVQLVHHGGKTWERWRVVGKCQNREGHFLIELDEPYTVNKSSQVMVFCPRCNHMILLHRKDAVPASELFARTRSQLSQVKEKADAGT